MMANLVRQFIYKEKGKTVFDSLDNTFIPTIINNSLLDEDHGCASYSSKCKVQIENQ